MVGKAFKVPKSTLDAKERCFKKQIFYFKEIVTAGNSLVIREGNQISWIPKPEEKK